MLFGFYIYFCRLSFARITRRKIILYVIYRNGKIVNIVELHEIKIPDFPIIIVELHKIIGRIAMKLNDAIVKRIEEICSERNSNVCDIALRGGMSPSAIYDIFKGRTKCSKVITVKRFCEGAGITLSEFFNRDYFNEPEED